MAPVERPLRGHQPPFERERASIHKQVVTLRRDLRRYGCVLVVSHGNTLRALIKHLEVINDDAVAELEVPNAQPLTYQFLDFRPCLVARAERHRA